MSTIHCVYELLNPTTLQPFYIGKTTVNRTKTRLREHIYEATVIYKDRKRKTPKVRMILKLLDKGHEPLFNVVYTTHSLEDAYNKEKELIKYYGRRNIKTGILYNLTDGGVDTLNQNITSKERKHLSLSKRGAKNGMYGKNHTPETKLLQSNIAKKSFNTGSRKLTQHTQEHRNSLKLNNPGGKSLSRPIYAICSDGNIVYKFESASAAARHFGKSNSLICKHATGPESKHWKLYGFFWRYADEYTPAETLESGKLSGNQKPVTQLDENNNIVSVWSNMKNACEAIGGNYPMLSQAIKLSKPYKGFYWKR